MISAELSDKARGCITMPDFWTTQPKMQFSEKQFDKLNDVDANSAPAQHLF